MNGSELTREKEGSPDFSNTGENGSGEEDDGKLAQTNKQEEKNVDIETLNSACVID